MARIDQLLTIKHKCDRQWGKLDTLLGYVQSSLSIPQVRQTADSPMESEFFDIIRANLGMQSQQHVDKLNLIMDTLVARATPYQVGQMYKT